MPDACFCLLCLCIAENVQNPKNYRNSISPEDPGSQKDKSRGGPQPPDATPVGLQLGWGWVPPGRLVHRLALPLHLYIHPDLKMPERRRLSPETHLSSAATKNPSFGGQKVLFWHPVGMGIDPRSHLLRLRHLHDAP